jgi:uncharacterized protein
MADVRWSAPRHARAAPLADARGCRRGTLAGGGWIAGANARWGTAALGVALVLYAWTGLANARVVIDRRRERRLGPIAGVATGLVTAATGVFVIPAVPYLASIGLDKDELVQALGLSFTVSTVALAVTLGGAGVLADVRAGYALGALAAACAGMVMGQRWRDRLSPATFRRWFFVGLLALGAYLIARVAF